MSSTHQISIPQPS